MLCAVWPQDGMTALMWSAHEGHTDAVRYLVEQGVDKEVQNKV